MPAFTSPHLKGRHSASLLTPMWQSMCTHARPQHIHTHTVTSN